MKTIGQPLDRVDGYAKVTGQASYTGDVAAPQMAHAVMVTSTIARGQIVSIDSRHIASMPGVLLVMTHENAMRLPNGGVPDVQPPAVRRLTLLQDDRVRYNNEPVAVVVADTLERATDAAYALQQAVVYRADVANVSFIAAQDRAYPPPVMLGRPVNSQRGDVRVGLTQGAAQHEAVYTTPYEHHNPMEPHATMARWEGPDLTLYDSTQGVSATRNAVAVTLGIPVEQVRVICPFVGGGFGCKGSAWSHTVLAAMAARQVGRPVRLVLQRPQMFGPVGNRPYTHQQLRISAQSDGTLLGMQHDATSVTSTFEDWTETSAIATRMLYAVPNQATTHKLVQLDVGTPTFTRAPGEASGTFALESAMDEVAYRLQMDPLTLRQRNGASIEPQLHIPWSSKHLDECYQRGAERFGWSQRSPSPRSMRDGPWLIGQGMATATYPANRSGASALVRILPDGTAVAASGTQDLGTGTYTVMAQVAADALGFPVGKVQFQLGDSSLPSAPSSGGSQSAASVSPAVRAAALAARDTLIGLALKDPGSPLHGADMGDVTIENGWLVNVRDGTKKEPAAAVIARNDGKPVEATANAAPGGEKKQYAFHSFGAVFAEVQVDADLGIVRVTRVVGVYDVGTILNEKTARSQLLGGIVWGIGAALTEASELDQRFGRYTNANLAEYHLPVNADVQDIDVTMLHHDDPHINPLGVRGIGEIGITGVAAAIANAVYHATGVRVRDLPITLDKVTG